MQIGQMSINTGPDGRVYGQGEFATLAMALKFSLAPNPDYKGEESQPVFVASVRNNAGALIPIGRAWKKVIGRGEHTGRDMFNLTFDDPSFERPLYVTAFPRGAAANGAATYALDWQRPRKPAAGQTGPTNATGDPGHDGDMIPD